MEQLIGRNKLQMALYIYIYIYIFGKITFSLRNKVLNGFSECLVFGEVPMILGNTVIVSSN